MLYVLMYVGGYFVNCKVVYFELLVIIFFVINVIVL